MLLKITGDASGKSYWYYVFGLPQAIFIIQTLLLTLVFPYETPKYWLSVGEIDEARRLVEIIYKPEFVDEIM